MKCTNCRILKYEFAIILEGHKYHTISIWTGRNAPKCQTSPGRHLGMAPLVLRQWGRGDGDVLPEVLAADAALAARVV